jgi:hypothetical protein
MRFGVNHRVLSMLSVLVLVACMSGISVSSAQAEGCANEQLRAEQPYGLELPDCRAYEMVSPLDKGDSDATRGEARVAVSGEAITYASLGSFANPKGASGYQQYISRRGSGGWSTQSITPPFSSFTTTLFNAYPGQIFTPDLSKGVTQTDVPLASQAQPGYENIYVRDTVGGSYELVESNVAEGEAYRFRAEPFVLGASTNLDDVVFEESGVIDEWADDRLSPVSIFPNGEPMGPDTSGGGGQEYEAGSDTWRAVSADGSRVIVTNPGTFDEANRQLYVREDNTTTVEVSASRRTDCADHNPCSGALEPDPGGPQSARYWGASVDGSRVFFTSCAKLTDDATAAAPTVPTEDHCRPGQAETGNDLYEYDLESSTLRDLTVDGNIADPDGAGVLGVVYVSTDGTYVYFVAEGSLAAGAVSDQPNLYVTHNGGNPSLIATLAPSESTFEGSDGDRADWASDPGRDSAVATPDGTHLAFLSTRSLTGYDNTDANTNLPDAEVFSYDTSTGALACASCKPDGTRPVGGSTVGDVGDFYGDLYTRHSYSDDGSRLFFQSNDALVTHDSNGRPDIYEYEDGHIYPISDVAGNFESSFLDASPNGSNVFIGTADQLTPSDSDFRVDVYDAKVDGGFPVSASAPTCENGDSCKPPVSQQPSAFGPPASATFVGAGNLTPPPAVKSAIKSKSKRLTRRQRLARALHACRKSPGKKTRCELQARRRYGARSKAGKSNGRSK